MRAAIVLWFVFSFLAILEYEVEANKVRNKPEQKIFKKKDRPHQRPPRPPRPTRAPRRPKHNGHQPPVVIPSPVSIPQQPPNDQGTPPQTVPVPEPVPQSPSTPVTEPPPVSMPSETPKEEEPISDVEMPPNPEVNELIEKFSMEIKTRANLAVQNEQDAEDLKVAPVEALSFIKIVNGSNEIFLVKVIIGGEYVVHLKIGRTKKKDGDGYDNVALMTEIPDKEDKDPLSKEEFGIK